MPLWGSFRVRSQRAVKPPSIKPHPDCTCTIPACVSLCKFRFRCLYINFGPYLIKIVTVDLRIDAFSENRVSIDVLTQLFTSLKFAVVDASALRSVADHGKASGKIYLGEPHFE